MGVKLKERSRPMEGELMGKRKDTTTPSDQPTRRMAPPDTQLEQRLVAFAEPPGRIAGTVQARGREAL
jgi:hypothetical protein